MDCTDKKEPKVVGLTLETLVLLEDAAVGYGRSKSALVMDLSRRMEESGKPLHGRVTFVTSRLAQRTSRIILMLTAKERAQLHRAVVAARVADTSEFIEGTLLLLNLHGLEAL